MDKILPVLTRIKAGQILSRSRTFQNADIQNFVRLTGDANPIHSSEADRIIVPGMLIASLIPSIFGSSYPGCLYLKQELKFCESVLVEESVRAEILVEKIKTGRLAQKGIITICDTKVVKEADEKIILEGKAMVLLPQSVIVELD